MKTSVDESVKTKAQVDPRIIALTERANAFFRMVAKDEPPMLTESSVDRDLVAAQPAKPADSFESRFEAAIGAASRLPRLERQASYTWPTVAGAVLPGHQPVVRPKVVWAPVVAWVVLSRLSPDVRNIAAQFDPLQLRAALAHSFSLVGINGEDTWRAAARVRILLLLQTYLEAKQALQSESFWQDPDVAWLAGISESLGKTYVNKECFEELLWWLELPELIEKAEQEALTAKAFAEIEQRITTACAAAQEAGYELKNLVALLAARDQPATTLAPISEPKKVAALSSVEEPVIDSPK
jgi:hypothetical protein